MGRTTDLDLEVEASDQACAICTFVIGQMDSWLEDPKDVEEIKEALDQACFYMPDSFQVKCKAFVDQYTELVIDMIARGATPKEVRSRSTCSVQK